MIVNFPYNIEDQIIKIATERRLILRRGNGRDFIYALENDFDSIDILFHSFYYDYINRITNVLNMRGDEIKIFLRQVSTHLDFTNYCYKFCQLNLGQITLDNTRFPFNPSNQNIMHTEFIIFFDDIIINLGKKYFRYKVIGRINNDDSYHQNILKEFNTFLVEKIIHKYFIPSFN